MAFKQILGAALLAMGAVVSVAANAAIVTVWTDYDVDPFSDSLNQGWWANNVGRSYGNDNHFTGKNFSPFSGEAQHRSFYSFNLKDVAGKITGAQLVLRRGQQSENVDLSFWDVSTPLSTLRPGGRSDAIFADLGSGTNYGSATVEYDGFETDYLRFSLNSAALADIVARAGTSNFFTIGAKTNELTWQSIFGGTQGSMSSLELIVEDESQGAVPEPASFGLMLLGAAGALAARRRKR